MKKVYYSLILSLFIITNTSGQNNSTLKEAVGELQHSLKEVSSKSGTYEQSIEWHAQSPHKLNFQQNKVGKKKTVAMSYEFSLKDIDVNTIRVKNKKDLMIVSVFIKNKQKLIKVFKDGEQEKYVNEVAIMALDNDNGKDIAEILKKAVKLTKDIVSSCDPVSFESRMAWLSENIQEFKINEATVEQVFIQKKASSPIVSYTIVERGKKSKEESWQFNLSDLNSQKTNLEVKDKSIFVEVQTKRNLKYIHYLKDGKQGNYTNKLKFLMPDFDQARCLIKILEKLIKDSEDLDANKHKKPVSLDSALGLLKETILDIKGENTEITQNIKASCITELERTEKKGKKDAVEELLKFNLSDIQPKSIKAKVKGKEVVIELSTGKNKLIQPFENGEIQKYMGKLSIAANSIENAKILSLALTEAVGFCKKEVTFKPSKDVNENFKWISEQLSKSNDTGEVKQTIKKIDGENCKWQLTVAKPGKKEDKEEIFEFNLENLDEKAIEFKISGKNLSIETSTLHHEKSIKYYENGEPGDYENAFLIQLNDLEDARNMIQVFKQAIKGCKG